MSFRSLEIDVNDNLEFQSNGTSTPFEITVKVDGKYDSSSFTISVISGPWLSFYNKSVFTDIGGVKRQANKIFINVPKNNDTLDRYSTLKIEHKNAKIVKYINITQKGSEFSLLSSYDNGWVFKSTPTEVYEEKSVTLSASQGTSNWYVKDIEQCVVLSDDSFDDKNTEYIGSPEQNAKISEIRIPYDNTLNYYISGNKLFVKSFGQTDNLYHKKYKNGSVGHMRYYFVLSHIDVDNNNSRELDRKGIKYDVRKLFIFDGNDGHSNGNKNTGGNLIELNKPDVYSFLVNNTKEPRVNVDTDRQTVTVNVESIKNGKSYPYTVSVVGNTNWCTINENGTKITVNENTGGYRECKVRYTQTRTEKGKSISETIDLIVKQELSEGEFEFTINGKTEDIIVPPFNDQDHRFTDIVIVSKKGKKDVPYSIVKEPSEDWNRFEKWNGINTIYIDKNPTYSNRTVKYTFTQGGGSKKKPISIIITQKAVVESWEFDVTPTHVYASYLGELIAISVTSIHNNALYDYHVERLNDDWLSMNEGKFKNNSILLVGPYSKEHPGLDRRTKVKFVQRRDTGDIIKEVTIIQKKPYLKFIDAREQEVDTMHLTFKNGGGKMKFKIKSLGDKGEEDENFLLTNKVDWLSASKPKRIGNGEFEIELTATANTGALRNGEIKFTDIFYNELTLTVSQTPSNEKNIFELESEDISVPYTEGSRKEDFAKLYSYADSGGVKTGNTITSIKMDGDSFIRNSTFEGPFTDEKGVYYKIFFDVSLNDTDKIRKSGVLVTNSKGESIHINVTQRKNNEIVLTDFDYIVMNYTWKDQIVTEWIRHGEFEEDSGGPITRTMTKDFDCVMFLNNPLLGKMNDHAVSFSDKYLEDNGKTYAELAYDQTNSHLPDGLSCIETQVIYIKKLKDDGYLNNMKAANQNVIQVSLYGNWYDTASIENALHSEMSVDLTIHTYKGGEMVKNDSEFTMKNIGGELKSTIKVNTFYIRSAYKKSGSHPTAQLEFDYMGVLTYDIRNMNAVFSPNVSLYKPLSGKIETHT